MVEIGGGEGAVPEGCEAPRAIVEALRGDRDIVAVEHAMDEAGGDVGSRQPRRLARHVGEKAPGGVIAAFLPVIMPQAIVGEPAHLVSLLEKGEALEGADADVTVLEP